MITCEYGGTCPPGECPGPCGNGPRRHVVMFSGGVTSWAVGRRVASRFGADNVTLLFADTLDEDEDLYRFLPEAAENIGVPITRVCDGCNPRQVMEDRGWVGNARVAQCSPIATRHPDALRTPGRRAGRRCRYEASRRPTWPSTSRCTTRPTPSAATPETDASSPGTSPAKC